MTVLSNKAQIILATFNISIRGMDPVILHRPSCLKINL
jgi:hypothetical protein